MSNIPDALAPHVIVKRGKSLKVGVGISIPRAIDLKLQAWAEEISTPAFTASRGSIVTLMVSFLVASGWSPKENGAPDFYVRKRRPNTKRPTVG